MLGLQFGDREEMGESEDQVEKEIMKPYADWQYFNTFRPPSLEPPQDRVTESAGAI